MLELFALSLQYHNESDFQIKTLIAWEIGSRRIK